MYQRDLELWWRGHTEISSHTLNILPHKRMNISNKAALQLLEPTLISTDNIYCLPQMTKLHVSLFKSFEDELREQMCIFAVLLFGNLCKDRRESTG